ncbi:unnamed protein product [Rotaria sp. Silwood1]|nr:unnamed protein product [Rotaria sp. Silwood1]CAF4798954.1 unnamed protein product [Rotaria sp. Silwood1]CAF4977115.1 unnamed protein product [Rotaria sp. Silwood1]
MIGVPVNSNSVYIPMVKTGCCKSEFDSTYPIHLNGIISQDDFRKSIKNINDKISSNNILIILSIAYGLIIIGGIVFFIVGGITNVNSVKHGFPILVGVGIALTIIGSIIFGCICFIIQSRRLRRFRQAINEESIKYSSRSSKRCSWRLDTPRAWFGEYRYHRNSQLVYHLVIDIGNSPNETYIGYQSNQHLPDRTLYYQQEDNNAPPPYSYPSAPYCSYCNVPRQDLSAKYCSSCGNSLN